MKFFAAKRFSLKKGSERAYHHLARLETPTRARALKPSLETHPAMTSAQEKHVVEGLKTFDADVFRVYLHYTLHQRKPMRESGLR